MSYPSILEYLAEISKNYFKSTKSGKTNLLGHAVQITGFHRKSIIRHLTRRPGKDGRKGRSGAKKTYSEELLLPHIDYLWETMDRISARRMKAALDDWLPFYHKNGVTRQVKYLLRKMSVSTLERLLVSVRKNKKGSLRGLSSTSPATHMKNKVPINTLDSSVTRPGYMQSDTVAHCGDRLIGEFVNSITFTDIHSTWTENIALFNKKGHEIRRCLTNLILRTPFKIIAINTDSGSEFLNMPVFNKLKENRIIFTRSRPYKKNDNCYVEQKNYTHVRQLFGYERID
ncbi:MAG: transposase family protein, partial [Halobacteriovoraceae bacterium]|nr:transposase family protein [Halobacteriovoraceae bacterium]